MTFAQKLAEQRKQDGWSVSALARALETSRSTIQAWERGTALPSFKSLEKLKQLNLI